MAGYGVYSGVFGAVKGNVAVGSPRHSLGGEPVCGRGFVSHCRRCVVCGRRHIGRRAVCVHHRAWLGVGECDGITGVFDDCGVGV